GGVGSLLGEGWLIDIGLALLMQTSVRNIANADYGIPRELALDGDIPCPGLGILESFALGGHNQRNRICSAPSGVVHGAKRHAGVGLEGDRKSVVEGKSGDLGRGGVV